MENLFKLVKDYEEYLKEGNSESLGLFGEWLKQKYSKPSEYLAKEESVNAVGPGIVASYMLGGMSSYMEMWSRLAFSDIPIVGMMDFGIVKKVELFKNPTKKEIISEAIAERTSCVEAIKRLVRNGILTEEVDKEDKRMKRVSLTDQGHELIRILDIKMFNLGKLLMGTLTETEKKSLIPPLKKLMGFHENLNKTKEKKDIKRVYGI